METIDSPAISIEPLEPTPIEVRAEREKLLLSEIDSRPPVEKLFDRLTAARITHYRPDMPPNLRQDIICWCCGMPYRPDDVMDGENIYLCGTCILTRKENIP